MKKCDVLHMPSRAASAQSMGDALTDLLQFRGRFDPFYSVGVGENRKM
jgi:hypothetical protein